MMQNLRDKSVLLFCPQFFGYEKLISEGLRTNGAKVVWFDDRPANDFFSKALIRLNKKFLARKTEKYYLTILDSLQHEHFDYLFLVNPEAIAENTLQKFRHAFPLAKCLLYMWDSFNNRKQNISLLPLFHEKFTFDPADAKKFQLKFRPLFYAKNYRNKVMDLQVDYDLLFTGTAHSDRYNLVKKMTSGMEEKRVKLYFYLSSKLLFYTKKITDRHFRKVSYDAISFTSLSHQNIFNLMLKTKAVLDINHPQQLGLTMRTFEVLGASKKLVTTNPDVVNYDFYDPCNVQVIDRTKPGIDLEFFNIPYKMPSDAILHKYSLEGWMEEIFH